MRIQQYRVDEEGKGVAAKRDLTEVFVEGPKKLGDSESGDVE